jgi:hypothetical protein
LPPITHLPTALFSSGAFLDCDRSARDRSGQSHPRSRSTSIIRMRINKDADSVKLLPQDRVGKISSDIPAVEPHPRYILTEIRNSTIGLLQFRSQVMHFRASSGSCTRDNRGHSRHIQTHPKDIKATSKASLNLSGHLGSRSQIKVPLGLTLPRRSTLIRGFQKSATSMGYWNRKRQFSNWDSINRAHKEIKTNLAGFHRFVVLDESRNYF